MSGSKYPATPLQCGRFRLNVAQTDAALVMGILNITPDSFSDGSDFTDVATAMQHAEAMVREGAAIIDVGAESTRPGADAVSAEDEWARLAPLLPALVKLGVPISVDTYKPETMRRAIDAGCDMINCIAGFRRPGAIDAVKDSNVALCVMHMQGEPQSMQLAPSYQNVVHEVLSFLRDRVLALAQAGIAHERMVLDPGYGFGKRAEHNLALLKHQRDLQGLGLPLLVGLSRKNTLGLIVNRPAKERLAASIAAALFAVEQGARIIRVHDVAATVDALKVWHALSAGKLQ